jgi:hypothetical protein
MVVMLMMMVQVIGGSNEQREVIRDFYRSVQQDQ